MTRTSSRSRASPSGSDDHESRVVRHADLDTDHQPAQVAILDVQAIVDRAVVVDDAIAIRPMTILGLGWDHRAMDGAQAAGFLATLRHTLQT
jgi:hypothetical protein